jgi:5-methylcytosine-specific restriction endonuclease McrA
MIDELEGIIFSLEHRKNLGLALKGREVWNKGLKGYMGGLTPFLKGHIPWNKGLKGFMGREKNYQWKGGISKIEGYRSKWLLEKRHRLGISKKYNSELGISYTKEYKKLQRQKRKALTKGGGELTLQIIQLVYEDNIKQFGTLTCYLCLKPILFGKDHLEHRIPLSRNGTNKYNNLAIACQQCNCKKHAKTEEEYRKEILNP